MDLPDEAWVVEQASDAGKLWYSMECISKEVACVGDNGCGAKASYGDYMTGKGGTCPHMVEGERHRHCASSTLSSKTGHAPAAVWSIGPCQADL